MNPYHVLGVEESASSQEIKEAYRTKAREFHPDLNKSESAEESFKEVQAAYQLLTDPQAREEYHSGRLKWSDVLKRVDPKQAKATDLVGDLLGLRDKSSVVRVRVPRHVTEEGGEIAIKLQGAKRRFSVPANTPSGSVLELGDGTRIQIVSE